MFTQIPLSSIPLGSKFSTAVFDDRRTKLIGEGIEVTPQMVDSLRKRSVDKVVVKASDVARIQSFRPQGISRTTLADHVVDTCPLETDHSRELDSLVQDALDSCLHGDPNPLSDRIVRHGPTPFNADFRQHLTERNEQNVIEFSAMSTACVRGAELNLGFVSGIAGDVIDSLITDIDAMTTLGVNPFQGSYPSRHSQHSMMLSLAMGVNLGLNENSLRQLGTGCLLHDIGMLAVDRRVFESKQVIGQGDFAEITKHPLRTFDIIEKQLVHISLASRLVAYQLHERCDGSGYPRRRTANQIHPLARLAAVADTYVALVTPRPHRPGMQPHCALTKIVKDVSAGRFDPKMVRALLETISLFPLGSFVSLTNGYVGRVIRANTAHYTKPMVEVWKEGHLTSPPSIIDLANDSSLVIEKPLATLAVR